MHAEDMRILYGYHFAANHKLWNESIMPLTDAQFLQPLDYSVGSIRNQVVHLMDIEEGWFGGLRLGANRGPFINPEDWPTRGLIREHWDIVEADIHAYLDTLPDEECNQPLEPESGSLLKWQVMLHVLNHATDHRAQILAMLHSMNAKTFPQDMVYHFWGVL